MKAHLIFLAFSMFAVSDALAQNRVIETSTENTSLIYTVGNDRRLIFRYYGSRISNPEEFSQAGGYTKPDTKREMNYEAYPSFGFGMVNEPAFSAVNPDGSLISEFVFDDSSMSQSGNLRHTVISMKDTVYNLNVELHTEAYIAEDVMKQWVVVRNMSGGPVTLKNFFSSYLNFHANKYYLTHFYGSWAGEMNRIEEKLTPGIKSVESKKGIRTTHSENPSFILSLDRPVSETSGKCVGGALAWSGNYRLVFEIDERNVLNILCGMNPFMADYRLENGENLESPQMIYTFSNNGQGTVSRNFHDWARKYALAHGAYFTAVRAKAVHSVFSIARHARPKLPHCGKNVFWQLYAHSLAGGLGEGIDYAERFVNRAHESLHSFLLASANKSEAFGYDRLLFKVENVSRAVRLKMQVVSHSE